jgi:hypothetical protein
MDKSQECEIKKNEVAGVSFMLRLKSYAEVGYDRYEHIMKEVQILSI